VLTQNEDDTGLYDTEIWYYDGVGATGSYTVTANWGSTGDAAIEVAQILGAANPSYGYNPGNPGSNGDTGTSVDVTVSSYEVGQLLVMSAVAPGATGTISYSPIDPTTNIQVSPALGDSGPVINVAGGFFQQPDNIGNYILSANITNSDGPVTWATVGAAIMPANPPYFCASPINAGLDLILISPT